MSTTTTNYNLVKQAGNERPDVSVLNANLDAIDATMASKGVFATCSTAAATAAKEASYTGFQLVTGATVYISFTYSNTAANATLNVNSTGAKAIYSNGSTSAANVTWVAGETVAFVYDGTYWRMVGSVGVNALRGSVTTETSQSANGTSISWTHKDLGLLTISIGSIGALTDADYTALSGTSYFQFAVPSHIAMKSAGQICIPISRNNRCAYGAVSNLYDDYYFRNVTSTAPAKSYPGWICIITIN